MTKWHTVLLMMLFLLSEQSTALKLNGISTHFELGDEQFIAALYLDEYSSNAQDILFLKSPQQMQIRIMADRLSSRRFKRMWVEGMAINATTDQLKTQSKNMAKFSNMLKIRLKRGDIFEINKDNELVSIYLNNVLLGEIYYTDFFSLLLR